MNIPKEMGDRRSTTGQRAGDCLHFDYSEENMTCCIPCKEYNARTGWNKVQKCVILDGYPCNLFKG